MTLQAFIDESEAGGVFVLAGCISSAEAWAKFSPEWEELLPLAPLDEDDQRNFKFIKMLKGERAENMRAFARVMERHVLCNMSFYMLITDFESALSRVRVIGAPWSWGDFANPYIYSFLQMMGLFHHEREKIVQIIGDEIPDFIFDERSEKKTICAGWDSFADQRSRELGGAPYAHTPRFEDDKRFLPLQAADFLAGWIRYWLQNGAFPTEGDQFAGANVRKSPVPLFSMTTNEDQIVSWLIDTARRNVPPQIQVIDMKPEIVPDHFVRE